MATIKLSVSADFYRKLKRVAAEAARDATPVIFQQAQGVIQASQLLVPTETGQLRQSAGVGSTVTTPTSAAVTAGYTHPEAGAIHEGWHWGTQTIKPPPHFLRKAAKASKPALKEAVRRVLASTVHRRFPR